MTVTQAPRMQPAYRALPARLGLMIWLGFFVFGVWFATMGLVLGSHGMGMIIGDAYLLSAVAAILSPLLLGAIGDRFLPPRTVLALAHLAGALAMAGVPLAVAGGNRAAVLGLIFAHMLFFQPTLGLSNAYALAVLGERQSIFPYVRAFGLLGWVMAGFAMGALGLSASTGVFYAASGAGLVMAAYAMTLPRTPPPAKGARFSPGDLIGVQALVLFRDRRFSVLMGCALMTSISLGIYNGFASPFLGALGIANVAGVLALGQVSEVIFVVTIPFVLKRIGMKWALFTGMAMWGLRFALFLGAGHGSRELAVVGVALHGICNDYFMVVSAMFIARIVPAELAAQAQGWLILMISGFGQAIGSAVSGHIYATAIAPHPEAGPMAWDALWYVPMALAAVTAAVWTLFFPSKSARIAQAAKRAMHDS